MTRRALVWYAVLGLCALAAGCAEVKEQVAQVREIIRKMRGLQPAPPPPAPPPAAQIPAPAAAGLNLNGNCAGKDETGYAENARIEVAGGQVRALEAHIEIPKRGSCSYRLADFNQTMATPYVMLVARSATGCALRLWQQGDRITLAPTDCADKCSRGAFEYAWPVEFAADGSCY